MRGQQKETLMSTAMSELCVALRNCLPSVDVSVLTKTFFENIVA